MNSNLDFSLEKETIPSSKALRNNHFWSGFLTLFLTFFCSTTQSVKAAEKLTLQLGPLQQSINVSDLEKFVETGEVSSKLKAYSILLTPQVRQMLGKSLHVDSRVANKFLDDLFRSEEGKKLIEQLNRVLPASKPQQLKAALNVAVRKNKDLSLMSFLHSYPIDEVTLDLTAAAGIAIQVNTAHLQSQIITPLLARDLKIKTNNKSLFHGCEENKDSSQLSVSPLAPHPCSRVKPVSTQNFSALDPAAAGKARVRKRTLILFDRARDRTIPTDIYYSLDGRKSPLVVMSHGFAANRKFLAYLANHLASHGLTVVSVEHPGSNIKFLSRMSLGIDLSEIFPASEFIDRPKDISFLLDRLERLDRKPGFWQNKFNTKQVTAIGHSFGGYTAFALAGGELNLEELRLFCQELSPLGRSPADWLQCAAVDLPREKIQLEDPRIAQAIVFNPIAGNLFGDSLARIDIPTLILSASEDAITPMIEHQLQPFKQLKGEKYLLMAIGGTHLSAIDGSNSNSPMAKSTLVKEAVGKEAESVRKLARGVSLAFIYQLTSQGSTYRPFLTAAYAQSFSNSSIKMRFASEVPTHMNALIDVLYFSNDQIAWRITKNKQWLIGGFRESFLHSKRILPQLEYCSEKLERVFTGFLDETDGNNS